MHELKGHKAVMSSVGFLGMLAATTVAHAIPIKSVRVDEVTFINALTISADTSTPTSADKVVYETPHWKRGRSLQSAVLEQASSEVGAVIYAPVSPNDATDQDPWTRGSAGPYIFYSKGFNGGVPIPDWVNTGGDRTWTTDIKPGNESDKLNITWKWTQDDGANWTWAGEDASDATSSNRMYIALGSQGGYHSVVDVSCKYGANAIRTGLTPTEYKAAVFSQIWEGFKSRRVYRAQDGKTLTYYFDSTRGQQGADTVPILLDTSDGHCDAWQSFFIDALKLQNITDATPVEVTPKPLTSYKGHENDTGYTARIDVKQAEVQGGATRDNDGFLFHKIVRSSIATPSALYDPSYGLEGFSNPLSLPALTAGMDWENKALKGNYYRNDSDDVVRIANRQSEEDCIYTPAED